jgi:hypothetical protein
MDQVGFFKEVIRVTDLLFANILSDKVPGTLLSLLRMHVVRG